MTPSKKLPKRAIVAIVLLSILPLVLELMGVSFSVATDSDQLQYLEYNKEEQAFQMLRAPILYSILEWSAFCVALTTALMSIVYYRIRLDVTTPIIGTAVFFSGMLDAFSSLTANRLLFSTSNPVDFFPFIWMVSRSFNVTILICGVLPFLFSPRIPAKVAKPRDVGSLVLLGILFGLMAYSIIHVFTFILDVPDSQFSDRLFGLFTRPWDAIPLMLMLFASGIAFRRFHRLNPSLFTHSLLWSMFPAIAAQFYVMFGSSIMFDSNANVACFLKILSYSVLLLGIIIDYIRAYNSEAILHKTETKLNAAREIQESLLPKNPPEIAGFDVAGFSYSAEAVGGDYFDYIPLEGNKYGLVVADVSGHDLGAALLMTQTRAYLRAFTDKQLPMQELMTRVNRNLESDTQARRFVTLVYLQVEAGCDVVEYCTAGHHAHIVRADETVITLPPNNLPMSIDSEDFVTELTPSLLDGDIILISTDGVTEARSLSGELFGLDRVISFIQKARDLSAADIVERLGRRIREFCSDKPSTDDVTLVLVKYNQQSTTLSAGDTTTHTTTDTAEEATPLEENTESKDSGSTKKSPRRFNR